MDDAAPEPFEAARRRLAAEGRRVREKHSAGIASLLVDDGEAGEQVLFYPEDGAPRRWRLPHDPFLEQLARLPELLRDGAWDPPLPPELREARVAERVMYNPGRRAAFFLATEASPRAATLKLLAADEAPQAIATLRAVAASRLPEQVTLPHLVATSAADGATLQAFLPGEPVAGWSPELVDELAGVLAAVNAEALDGVPDWSPARDARKLERHLRRLEGIDPELAAALRPAHDALAARLQEAPYAPTTIHRDFAARHVLLVPGAPGGRRLGILDWDSVSRGPREKDLSTILGDLREHGPRFVTAYEERTGAPVDRELLALLQARSRLTRVARRRLAGKPLGRPLDELLADLVPAPRPAG